MYRLPPPEKRKLKWPDIGYSQICTKRRRERIAEARRAVHAACAYLSDEQANALSRRFEWSVRESTKRDDVLFIKGSLLGAWNSPIEVLRVMTGVREDIKDSLPESWIDPKEWRLRSV